MLKFANWSPDSPDFDDNATEASGVIPEPNGYRPFKSLGTVSNALTARAQGAAWFRAPNGTTKNFVGDATKLYLLSSATWSDVGRLISVPTLNAPSTSTTGGTLAAGTYYYVLTALTANGETSKSNEVSQVTTGTTSTVTLTWSAVTNATGYRVYRGTAAGLENVYYAPGNVTTYTDTGSAATAGSPPASNTATNPYGTGGTNNWRYAQFGSLAYATNGVDALQSFDLSAGTNWIAAAGSPTVCNYIGVVQRFLVLANLASFPQRVNWSGENNAGTFASSATTLADFQDQPDGGQITGFLGGEYGVVFQEEAIRRMTFEGSPTVFRFDKVAQSVGATIPNSVAGWGNIGFFCHRSGFYRIDNGSQITPIGRNPDGASRVDRWFWGRLDQGNMHRVTSAFDPVNGLYIISFPGQASSNGTPNELLIYSIYANRWSHASVTCEMIYAGATQQAYTLEQLDAFGTLETLPYSLDSSYWSGSLQLLLSGFDTSHKYGTFSGSNLAASVTTQEVQPTPGRRCRVRGARPITDGSPTLQLGYRSTQSGAVAWTSPRSASTGGQVPFNISSRYFRVQQNHSAGDTWQWMQGIDDLDAKPAGMR